MAIESGAEVCLSRPALGATPVFILAGGFGTRLRSSFSGPKALALVNDRPFLLYLLERLYSAGFEEAVLCLGHKADEIESCMSASKISGPRLYYSREERPLGTAGALRLAAKRYAPGRRFFAMNGDSILELDYAAMLGAHINHKTVATIALALLPDSSRYGMVDLNDSDRIVQFREKVSAGGPGYINGGAYILEPEVMDLIPSEVSVSIERDIFPELCRKGMGGFRTDGYFIDIGIPEDLARAQAEFSRAG